MKTMFCFWKLLAAAIATAALIPACDNGLTDDTGGTSGMNIMDKRYETVPYKSTAESGEDYALIYSTYDDTGNYYIFLLGKIKYVPVAYNPYLNYNGATPQTIRYSKSQFEQVTITESLQTAVNHSVTYGTSTELSLKAKAGFGKGLFEASIEGSVSQKWYRDETESRSFTSTYTTETVKGFEEKNEFTATIGEHGEPAGHYRYAFFTTTDVYYVVKTNKAKTTVTESYIAFCNRPGGSWYLDYVPSYDDTFGKTESGDLLKTPDIVLSELPAPQTEIITPIYRWSETRSVNGNEDISSISYNSRNETFSPGLSIPALQEHGYTKLKIDVAFAYKGDWMLIGGGTFKLQIANANGSAELGRAEFNYTNSWTNKSYSKTIPIYATNSNTGQFMLLWSRVEGDGLFSANFSVGKRTVTITALK
ncbi:MAG: hypothetical protein LBJ86_07425 [Spirochaetaceae bacterium]|jgi:hypothetical protein|nr:hypothetical protein [Spirochaetaceae bacterium]